MSKMHVPGIIILAIMMPFLICGFSWADDAVNNYSQVDVITYVPRSMTYQGILKNADDEPIPESFFDVTFRIFDAESDGNQEWTEAFSDVETDSEGRFTVTFTSVDLGFDEDYWLELEIDGEILAPRQKLNMTPFAGASVMADYAWDANTLDGLNSEDFAAADHAHSAAAGWVDYGAEIILETPTDNVGMGTMSPQAPLHVESMAAGPWGTIYGRNSSYGNYGYLGGSAYGAYGSGYTAGLYATNPSSGNFGYLASQLYGLYASAIGVDSWAGYFNGRVRINSDLVVNNNISAGTTVTTTSLETAAFRMNNGAITGHVLTSDASGYGTWQPTAQGLQGSGTTNNLSKFISPDSLGNSQIFDNGTNVGVGLTSPGAKLDVNGDIWSRGGLVVDNSALIGDLIDANRITISQFRLMSGASANYILTSDASGNGTWQPLNAIGGSGGVNYIPKFGSASTVTNSIIYESGSNIGIGTTSPSSKLDVNGNSRLRGNLVVDGEASISGEIDAMRMTMNQFQKTGGASSGYVLTSDASGNGTWQALPPFATGESIKELENKINEMLKIIDRQNEKIAELEKKITDIEQNR